MKDAGRMIKNDRRSSVYTRTVKDFSKVEATYGEGYIHTVRPIGEAEERDLVWTGIMQKRYMNDERFRSNLRPDLTDDQVADKWWAGERSETPEWEWVAKQAVVVDVENDPVAVRPNSPLLNIFDNM